MTNAADRIKPTAAFGYQGARGQVVDFKKALLDKIRNSRAEHVKNAADPNYKTFEDRLGEVFAAIEDEKKYFTLTGDDMPLEEMNPCPPSRL